MKKIFDDAMNISVKDKYNEEEINDYITLINSYPAEQKIKELNKKLMDETDPIKQAEILTEILVLKGVK
jgi:hypothetical protein